MKLFFLVIVVVGPLFAGCRTSRNHSGPENEVRQMEREQMYYWGQYSYLSQNHKMLVPAEELCKDANDESRTRAYRQFMSALLLASNAKIGNDSSQIHEFMTDPRWLEQCNLDCVVFYEGDIDFWCRGPRFCLSLFPDEHGRTHWKIYFAISANVSPIDPAATEIAGAFLRGTYPDKSVKLTELFLLYPYSGGLPGGYIEERHAVRGVGLRFMPEEWYE